MPSKTRQFGDTGEREAESFLLKMGYRIVDRNYRIKNLGEIDLVGDKGGKLFFFEVKTRDAAHKTVFPIQYSINSKKRRNLKRICHLYIDAKKLSADQEWQVDAIFVSVDFRLNSYKIEHLENILWEEYY